MLSISSYYNRLNNIIKKSNKENKSYQITELLDKENYLDK